MNPTVELRCVGLFALLALAGCADVDPRASGEIAEASPLKKWSDGHPPEPRHFRRCHVPFRGVGFLEHDTPESSASDVSADGSTVTGTASLAGTTQAFRARWTMRALGLFDGRDTVGTGVSGDGSVVSGFASEPPLEAFVWSDGVLTPLGLLPGGESQPDAFSRAEDVSRNGRVVVGASTAGPGRIEAFRWTARHGMEPLGTPSGDQSIATGVNRNGSVIVGNLFHIGLAVTEAFAWRRGRGITPLGFFTQALGVSDNGKVVVGSTQDGAEFPAAWSRQTGWVQLASEPGAANAASADGSIIVGVIEGAAMIWDEAHGARLLEDVLREAATLPSGWALHSATGVSADGGVVVGNGLNPQGRLEGFVACLP